MSETVQTYLDKHSLQTKVEEVLNSCVKAKPDEPLSFMAKEMLKLAPAVILKVEGRQIIDSRGNPTVEAGAHRN